MTLSGAAFLTASLIVTQPPLEPGTAPFTMISPRSASVRTTCRFCVVTRTAPMWPAIFLPLNTLPGSWHWPVEPCAAVADRHAVRCPEAAEVVPLHAAGEALADRGAGDVDELAGEIVVRGDLLADADQVLRADPELGQLALRLDLAPRRSGRASPGWCSSPWRCPRRAGRRNSRRARRCAGRPPARCPSAAR